MSTATSGHKFTDEYFADIPAEEPDRLANAMQEKVRQYRTWASSRGLIALWNRKLSNYYGIAQAGNSSQQVVAGGAEGELSLIKVNDLHSLIQEQLVTITGQRPAGIAKAINSNTDALKSAKIGTAIAEYYMSQLNFEAKFVQCAEIALLCDESHMDLFWDKSAGDPIAIDPDTNLPEMSGDLALRVHSPWNVARDPGLKVDQQKWVILSFTGNKFDLAAQYPKFRDDILRCGPDDNLGKVPMNSIPDDSDAIWQHLLIHDRTAARPAGRYSLMIGDRIVLDTDLPYKDYPVERMSPEDVIDGPTGYSQANDLMGLEQLTDALHSIIASNEITFGGQNIVIPEGNNMKVSDIVKGLRAFELPPNLIDSIKALDLCHTPVEVFNYIGVLQQKKEKAVGSVSSTLMAQAAQGASGSSMALIQTQSISYNSGTQRSYFRLLSSGMTKAINILRVFADTPKVARIVGKSKAAGLKEFKYTGEDLSSISSIVYEMVNPMFQTQGGRLTAAQDLLKAGQIKSPKQYINLAATGQTEVLTQDDEADGLSILEENEALQDGRPVKAVITEFHSDHIKSHLSLNTPEAKINNAQLVIRVLDHVQEHIDLWTDASLNNPGILLATGQQPLFPPQIPGAPAAGPPQPQGAPGLGKEVGGGQSPAQIKAQEVRMPGLPTIAGTRDQKPIIPGVTQ